MTDKEQRCPGEGGPSLCKGTVAGKENEGMWGLALAQTGTKGTERTEWKNVSLTHI